MSSSNITSSGYLGCLPAELLTAIFEQLYHHPEIHINKFEGYLPSPELSKSGVSVNTNINTSVMQTNKTLRAYALEVLSRRGVTLTFDDANYFTSLEHDEVSGFLKSMPDYLRLDWFPNLKSFEVRTDGATRIIQISAVIDGNTHPTFACISSPDVIKRVAQLGYLDANLISRHQDIVRSIDRPLEGFERLDNGRYIAPKHNKVELIHTIALFETFVGIRDDTCRPYYQISYHLGSGQVDDAHGNPQNPGPLRVPAEFFNLDSTADNNAFEVATTINCVLVATGRPFRV